MFADFVALGALLAQSTIVHPQNFLQVATWSLFPAIPIPLAQYQYAASPFVSFLSVWIEHTHVNATTSPSKIKLNILVAEDNQFTATQYERILKKYGHNVTITRDGVECLEEYRKQSTKSEFDSLDQNPFDVVVLDQSMPKKSGSEVATQILSAKPTQKIIFASAYALTGSEENRKLEDSVEYLQKPFSLNTFVQKIQS